VLAKCLSSNCLLAVPVVNSQHVVRTWVPPVVTRVAVGAQIRHLMSALLLVLAMLMMCKYAAVLIGLKPAGTGWYSCPCH